MFLKPQKVAAVAPARKVAGKTDRPLDLIPGYAEFAAIAACSKALTALLALKKTAVEAAARDRLIARGIARHGKPDTMTLSDRGAAGSAYMRRKDVRSPLGPDELELLGSLIGGAEKDDDGNVVGVPGITEIVEASPAMLAVNAAYVGDETLLQRIDKALSGLKGIPEDFIVAIPAVAKTVVADTALDTIFREKVDVIEQTLSLLGSVVLKPVYRDIDAAWDIVRPMLQEAPAEAEDKPARRRA